MLRSTRMRAGGPGGVDAAALDPTVRDDIGGKPAPFYFQQRRGRLDIRSVSQIDVDRIVRDVDIDLLQAHLENLTFCALDEADLRYLSDPQIVKLFRTSQLMIEYLLYAQDQLTTNLQQLAEKYMAKKRSLTKKRMELVSLQESTKHLREEVRIKKNSVLTLEDLLKLAHQNNHERRRHRRAPAATGATKSGGSSGEEGEAEDDAQPTAPSGIRQPVVRFYVTAADGLCVEFHEKRSASVMHVANAARKALVPRQEVLRYRRTHGDVDGPAVRLVYKGRVLTEDETLESCEVNDGDAIVAIVDLDADPATDDHGHGHGYGGGTSEGEAETKRSDVDVAKILMQQQETLQQVALEMKRGLDAMARTSTSTKQVDVVRAPPGGAPGALVDGDLVDRWNEFERTMWSQLDSRMEQYKDRIAADVGRTLGHPKPYGTGLEVGELESDGEEPRMRAPRRRVDDDDDVARASAGAERVVAAIDNLNDSVEELTDVIRAAAPGLALEPLVHAAAAAAAAAAASAAAPRAEEARHDAPAAAPAPAPVPVPSQEPAPVAAATPSVTAAARQAMQKPPSTVKWSDPPARDAVTTSASAPATGAGKGGGVASVIKSGTAPTPVALSNSPADLSGFADDIEEIEMEPSPMRAAVRAVVEEAATDEREADDDADALVAELVGDAPAKASAPAPAADPSEVSVVFPFMFMDASLAAVAAAIGERDWTVRLLRDAEVEDVIFDLRRGVSEKAKVPFKRVSLVLFDRPFTMAVDIAGGEEMTAVKAAEWAQEGSLTATIAPENAAQEPSAAPPLPTTQARGDAAALVGLPAGHAELRRSLEATLQELSDKEGLSDAELDDKMSALRRSTSSVELEAWKATMAQAVDAAVEGSPRLDDDLPAALQLSGEEKAKLRKQLEDGTRGLRESRDSTVDSGGSGGLVRLSLPNGGRGRRSLDSLDNDEDFKIFGGAMNQSAISIRGYDEDSVPMMQSLSSFPTPLARCGQGEGLDDVDDSTQAAEASNLDSRGPRDSVDSVSLGGGIGGLAGRLPGKRISFDDERESKDSGVGGKADGAPPVGPRPLAGPTHSAEVVPRASVGDDRSVRSGGSRVEDDSLGPGTGTGTGTGTISFAISEVASETTVMGGSQDLGGTTKTVSTLGASGKSVFGAAAAAGGGSGGPRDDAAVGKVSDGVAAAGKAPLALGATGGTTASELARFDLDRTVDSDGELLRGGGGTAPPPSRAQVQHAADAYERAVPAPGSRPAAAAAAHPLHSPPPKARPGAGSAAAVALSAVASPTSHGSSFTNSGLFDNLTDADAEAQHELERTREHDASNSLALSDSAGAFEDHESKL